MTRRKRAPLADPGNLTPEGEAFLRDLEQKAEGDLARHPERRRYARAGSPDAHRQRRPQQAGPRRTGTTTTKEASS